MTLAELIMVLGGLVALMPFLGFPAAWKTFLLVALGLCILSLGIVARRRGNRMPPPRIKKARRAREFIENMPRDSMSEQRERFEDIP